MAITIAEVRVFELRIQDRERHLREVLNAPENTGLSESFRIKQRALLEGELAGLTKALNIFIEEFGRNGRTSRAA